MGHERLSAEEAYSYRDLCVKIFHTTLSSAMYAQRLLTQADIDGLPQLVRLANKQKIKELRFEPHINLLFRLRAAIHRTLDTVMEEELYHRALEGGVAIDFFKRS
jgi:hypothetical protein